MPDVVIPVLDEAAALPALLDDMPPGYWPIVVDNGSSDGSAAIAEAHGARVVREPMPHVESRPPIFTAHVITIYRKKCSALAIRIVISFAPVITGKE